MLEEQIKIPTGQIKTPTGQIKIPTGQIKIQDDILISNLKDFYGENDKKTKENALRFSVEKWYKRNKAERNGAICLAKELNNLKKGITEKQKKSLGEKGVKNVEKHGFLPIETIEISVLDKKKN